MKTMTCKQLGGTCDEKFEAETFEEMAVLSKAHAMLMFQKQDMPHLEAMNKMKHLMEDNTLMMQWLKSKKDEFDALPNN